jgi:hypothetical protein
VLLTHGDKVDVSLKSFLGFLIDIDNIKFGGQVLTFQEIQGTAVQ